MYFEIDKETKEQLDLEFDTLPQESITRIKKFLVKKEINKKPPSFVLKLYLKSISENKFDLASYLYKYIHRNDLINKTMSKSNIVSPKLKALNEFKNNVKNKKLITKWNVVKINQKIWSMYSTDVRYFQGVTKTHVYMKDSPDGITYCVGCINHWYMEE